MWRTLLAVALGVFLLAGMRAPWMRQRAGAFMGSSDDPAIRYSAAPLNNAVVDVNRRLQDGSLQFTFESRSGFLRSALDALQIPVDSQLLVFSRTSLQGKRISEQNPRALFFNDRVALGWVRGGDSSKSRRTTSPPASCFTRSNSAPMRRPARRSSSGPSSAWGVT